MVRLGAGVFLVLHSLITGAIWIPPQRGGELAGFGSQASWLFASSRPTMVALGVTAAATLGLAGIAVLADQGWWAAVAAVGAVVSLALIVATFTPWWSVAVLINIVVLYVAWQSIAEQHAGA
jgi:hypothetical protein